MLEEIPADLKVRKHLHMAIDLASQLGSLRLAMDGNPKYAEVS